MNRHERRAAQSKHQSPGGPSAPFGEMPAINIDVNAFQDRSEQGVTAEQPVTPTRPSFATKLLSTALLSRWVLARVQHPDVERLLMSFAVEVGRQDVIDELIRRQALRR